MKRNIRKISGVYSGFEMHNLRFWNGLSEKCWPIYPFALEECRRKSSYSFGESNCPYLLLLALRSGYQEFQVAGEKVILTPEKVLIIPPGTSYHFHSNYGNFYHKFVVEIKGINLLSILETLELNRPLCLNNQELADYFWDKFIVLNEKIEKKSSGDIAELMGEIYALLARISLEANEKRKRPVQNSLNIIHERLENNLAEKISVQSLAREFHMNPAVMSRGFKKKFGMSPKEYRIRCRLERAKYLLAHTNLLLKEIAYQTGYCNEFYFSQEFFLFTGSRPGQWRTLRND